jgi:hypothetical protein
MRLTALFATCAAIALSAFAAEAKTVAVTADRLVDVATGKEADKPQVIIVDGGSPPWASRAIPSRPGRSMWTCPA